MTTMIDYQPEAAYKDLPSPRILNSHMIFKNLPEQVAVKKPKIIYLTRNPKDATVSYYNFETKLPHSHYSGKWENYYRPAIRGKFAYGSWFDYVTDWEKVKKTSKLPILTLAYEDLQEDTVREAKKICDFLELARSDEFMEQVCQQCDFNKMKQKTTHSLTSQIAYRKGQVGDWKNWFTVAQNEWFDQLYQKKMKDCQLAFRYTLDNDSR